MVERWDNFLPCIALNWPAFGQFWPVRFGKCATVAMATPGMTRSFGRFAAEGVGGGVAGKGWHKVTEAAAPPAFAKLEQHLQRHSLRSLGASARQERIFFFFITV